MLRPRGHPRREAVPACARHRSEASGTPSPSPSGAGGGAPGGGSGGSWTSSRAFPAASDAASTSSSAPGVLSTTSARSPLCDDVASSGADTSVQRVPTLNGVRAALLVAARAGQDDRPGRRGGRAQPDREGAAGAGRGRRTHVLEERAPGRLRADDPVRRALVCDAGRGLGGRATRARRAGSVPAAEEGLVEAGVDAARCWSAAPPSTYIARPRYRRRPGSAGPCDRRP